MGLGFNDRKKQQQLLNELIKSPKQVRPLQTRDVVEDCIVPRPCHLIKANVQEVVFSNVSFCSDFSLVSVAGNKLIIMEDCIFHSSMYIHCLNDVRIIIRNCRFRKDIKIKNLRPGMLELSGASPDPAGNASPLTPDTTFSSDIALIDRIILN